MKNKLWLSLSLSLLLLPLAAQAQPGSQQPKMLDCGKQGDAEIICGTRAPEDLEPTPDGKFLIVAKFSKGDDAPLDLFELATQKFTAAPLYAEKRDHWGEPACKESLGDKVISHGLSFSKRSTGEWQLFVVNHNVRESMEMYEVLPEGKSWKLVWRGCVIAQKPYNDVAALPDGGFLATRPQSIQKDGEDVFGGQPTGDVGRWTAQSGEQVLPGSAYGFPNGVVVSADGRYAYITGWTTRDFHKYDLLNKKEVGKASFTFMPDNLTWTPDGKILAAGVNGVSGNCPSDSTNPCIQGFGVAEIDPATLKVTTVYDSKGKALINGVSVALQLGHSVYIGAFQGNRIVKLSR